ncbi:hypothetical protein BASA81_010138 [Batrachochytrium salamandrivorans]|nr:hypothetical protein BASA81_010138 [Batrachochytrium salamandrivorans]
MLRTTWTKRSAQADTCWVITTKQKATYGKSPKLVQKDSFLPKPVVVEEKRRYSIKDVAKAKQRALVESKSALLENLETVRKQSPHLYEEFLETPRIKRLLADEAKPRPVKSTKWYQHMMRLEEKMLKETTVFNELRLLKSRKQMVQAETEGEVDELLDKASSAKRIPSLLMAHLKGIPEDGKLLPPRPPKGDPSLTSARMLKMGRKVQQELADELGLKRHLDLLDEQSNTVPQIVEVNMSPDLRRAICFWEPHSMLGPLDDHAAQIWQRKLERSTPKLKRLLALRIRARFVPELVFRYRALEEDGEDKPV